MQTPLGGLWGLATIIGPILFVAVLVWVVIRNRRASPQNEAIAEQSAIDVREEMAEDRKAEEREVKAPH